MRLVALLVLGFLVVILGWHSRRPGEQRDARFASLGELRSMTRGSSNPNGIVLGRFATARWRSTRRELSTPSRESVLILGPTQSGKTSSLVIPAILGWEGPVLAASVKDDLVTATSAWRRSQGPVGVFDPNFALPGLAIGFDPVLLSGSWTSARRVANSLMASSMDGVGPVDAQFWSQLAAKFLGPLLLAAFRAEEPFSTVTEWIDRRSDQEPLSILQAAGERSAHDALLASLERDERQLSSIYATIEATLEPLLQEGQVPQRLFDPERVLTESETLYLCAPAHDQFRYRSLFTAITSEVLNAAFSLARRQGGSLDKPLLVILDEAAAIAPMKELDVIAATCASHNITLVTCFQDVAQIRARYAERWATVVNNHRTRVFLSGLADPAVAELLSVLAGEVSQPQPRPSSPSAARSGSPRRRLIEPFELREMPLYRGVVVSGRLPAFRIALHPWWRAGQISQRGPAQIAGYAGLRDRLRRLRPQVGYRSDSAL